MSDFAAYWAKTDAWIDKATDVLRDWDNLKQQLAKETL